jgi:translocation and assembly module TamB
MFENDPDEERTLIGNPGSNENRPRGSRWWERVFTRRNALFAALGVAIVGFLILSTVFLLYRIGYVDRVVANQIVNTLATYGIRAEIGTFQTKFSPRTVEIRNIQLFDAATGAQIGKTDRILAKVRIEDLYALNLKRHVNLEELEIERPELWVTFDEQGRSNFSNLRLPPPEQNKRILFSYSTAKIKIDGGLVHYGDARHEISGTARNFNATIQPENPNAPSDGWANLVNIALKDSTFVYDGRPVNNIDIEARGKVDQKRAEIHELILRSPIAEMRLNGTMDDWRSLRYQLQATSTVDLMQTANIFQPDTAVRGTGKFTGTVVGEGDQYQLKGEFQSESLAADGLRLKALDINASIKGDGAAYEANGKAIAELLTAGEFRLNMVQLAGKVTGTGSDFRWLGELHAAAARSGDLSITQLMFKDAIAEAREEEMKLSAGNASFGNLNSSGTQVSGIQASGLKLYTRNGVTTANLESAKADSIVAKGARINSVIATGIEAIDKDGTTNITVDKVSTGGLVAVGARTGTINIAGVKLAVHEGRIVGSSDDINVGTVNLANTTGDNKGAENRIENVKLTKPVFIVEPSGTYRASADLSLGGGVLGDMKLGTAHSKVVATNTQIQLNDFAAELFNGRATGTATISTVANGTSRVSANFSGVDVGGVIAAVSGRIVPITGGATGKADLTFPETDVQVATGTVDAHFTGETGDDTSGRVPVSGDLALRADRGTFNIEEADLKTGASHLRATGDFSFNRDSNLNINLDSTDATELQRVLVASNLIPGLEDRLEDFGLELAGKVGFNGTIRGQLTDPAINGEFSLDSLNVQGRDLGALSASINTTPEMIAITNGQLNERNGGGVQFAVNIPRYGENNIELNATLQNVEAENLLAAMPALNVLVKERGTLQSELSGQVRVSGYPGAMVGNADLRFGPGRFGSEGFEEIIARARFSESEINLETLDARFNTGRLTATGTLNPITKAFNFQTEGKSIRLDLIKNLLPNNVALPQLSGTADIAAQISGTDISKPSTFNLNIDGEGRDIAINGRPAGILKLTGRTEDRIFNLQLTSGLLGEPQTIAARVDLSNDRLPTSISASLSAANLTPLFATLLPQAAVRITGRATGTFTAEGNLIGDEGFTYRGLSGAATFEELGIQIEDIPLNAERPLVVRFSPQEVTFEKVRFTGPGTNILFGGTAATAEGGRQNLSVEGDLNLQVLNGISPNFFLAGAAHIGVRMTGTYEDPRLTGTASIDNGSFSTLVSSERLTVSNVKGNINFTSNQAELRNLEGTLGGGKVIASGGAVLEGLIPSQFRVSLRGDNVTVPYPADFNSMADADITVSGSSRSQIITGLVTLRRTEYTRDIDIADLINRRREASLREGGGGEGGLFSNAQLDLRVEGREGLIVRNNLADMVGSVSLQIVGSIDDPIISGRVTASRGTFNFRNNRYELTRAIIDLPARRDADPILNIQAESEIRGYRVMVNLNGALSQMQADVRSDPALPQMDVVSLITTGQISSGEASASTLAQSGVGTAASLLTETLINTPAQRATEKLFGLNRFGIEPLIAGREGQSPSARVTIGRQVNRNLLITYSTNVTSDRNQVLAVEYRLTNKLSFVAQYEEGSINDLRSGNNSFSFEVRLRKRF